ncbi:MULTISPECIES: DUF6193 family natural product biosynthesis protein [unclassified Streptomyces]|uniref:DUF6193 family natural product biosynthesis protein n=1 Tax=unclassified Streptomyces TaxID=2593676 RepID=UPI0024A9D4DE|nr:MULTISPECIES: DUF6193 family natural product biosynthesis protein [unclassified Streptomyces]
MAKKNILGTAPDDPVAAKWQVVRDMNENLIDTALVEAAYTNPALRALFPLVSHGSLQFSRCTRFPWSQDLPSIFPHGERHFRVRRLHEPRGSGREQIGGAVTADEAVELVALHLPPGCGPALDGTPDDLESLS